jgi:ribosomal protein S12 methylthiotransferase
MADGPAYSKHESQPVKLPILDAPPSSRSAVASSDSGPPAKGSYAFISLGCPKNLVDSERMLGRLQLDGYRLVAEPDGADFVVINTCGFIEQARRESLDVIDEMLRLKRQGRTRGVIVSGCLAERQREALLAERPEIDSLIGVFARDDVTHVADRLVGRLNEQRNIFQPASIAAMDDSRRLRITPRHFAYLKISEGCDRLCTFCAIPRMRGRHITKPLEQVVAEARELAADGVRELVIVAQDTTYYGMDLYGRPQLSRLLRELEPLAGIDWIRLMYFYPQHIDAELLDVIADSPKIVPYIDMPLQHANDVVLRRMARRTTRAQIEDQVGAMRERIRRVALRTTFIVGFPGETDDQFAELVEFVGQQRFERMGVFTYSLEPDTPAARLGDQIPEEIQVRRRDELMEVQQGVATQFNASLVGQTLDVIIDRAHSDQPGVWVGRTPYDAPEVDGLVYVTAGEQPVNAGLLVRCEVVAYTGYDLAAYAVAAPR